jgi:hypothetical protein
MRIARIAVVPVKLKPTPVETELRSDLVLVPELTPRSLWGKGACDVLPPQRWKAICEDLLAQTGQKCAVCSGSDGLLCSECWQFDDELGVAMITGFRVLCARCDNVVHMGRAIRLGFGAQTLERLCRVNGIDPFHALALFGHAMNLWRSRSRRQWRIVVDGRLLERYPDLMLLGFDPKAAPATIN